MKAIKHVEKYILKNYPEVDFASLKKTETSAKIFTETEVITINYSEADKKVAECRRLRRGAKALKREKSDDAAVATSKKLKKNKPNSSYKLIFCEGNLVENIYTGKRYTVVSVNENVLCIADIDATYNTYMATATDFLQIIK